MKWTIPPISGALWYSAELNKSKHELEERRSKTPTGSLELFYNILNFIRFLYSIILKGELFFQWTKSLIVVHFTWEVCL